MQVEDNYRMPYAHSLEKEPHEAWQPLEAHLRGVSELAARFCSTWGGSLAGLAGLWHDLGKYAPDWQEFLREVGQDASSLGEEQPGNLRGRRHGPDHSTAGAVHAAAEFGQRKPLSLALQWAIAGHHAGLSNNVELEERICKAEKRLRYEQAKAQAPNTISKPGVAPSLPGFLLDPQSGVNAGLRAFETFVRMMFSALVDADFLDTERFFDSRTGEKERMRRVWRPLFDYVEPLESHLSGLERIEETFVIRERRRVLDWCREAASRPRGVFTLTVPTGGGKTLSSLAFALHHARFHRLQRVIVALPFISILDQTVDVCQQVFSSALGEPYLVEHHSNLDEGDDTDANRLASENWDAPLIVTTQVQLFESLFANRPRACRKLHNLSNAVIVLDEVQTLPVSLLAPLLDQLQQLHSNYGATLLLMTATQPSLNTRQLGTACFPGLSPEPREIVPASEMSGLFSAFERVRVHWPEAPDPVPWDVLAQKLVRHEQVLAIVHLRRDARDLFDACRRLGGMDLFHLSALMCAAHRRLVLKIVRKRLRAGQPCRVVSTSLVEAGVDVDFPVVYRSMAGLESLAQAAGRCNREGRLTGKGDFFVFRSASNPPGGLRFHRDTAEMMVTDRPDLNLFAPETFREYFDQLYAFKNLDSQNVQPMREKLCFKDVAAQFRMIDDSGAAVLVAFDDRARRVLDELRYVGPSRERLRRLQPYTVNVYPDALKQLGARGGVELLHESFYVLVDNASYDGNLGLLLDGSPFALTTV